MAASRLQLQETKTANRSRPTRAHSNARPGDPALLARFNPDDEAAEAAIRLYTNKAGRIVASLFDQALAHAATAMPAPDLGLSLVFNPEWQAPRKRGPGEPRLAT
jgi:hypothetical protein